MGGGDGKSKRTKRKKMQQMGIFKSRTQKKRGDGSTVPTLKQALHCKPDTVQTHKQQSGKRMNSLNDLLTTEPVLVQTTGDEDSFQMAHYCGEACRLMAKVLELLELNNNRKANTTNGPRTSAVRDDDMMVDNNNNSSASTSSASNAVLMDRISLTERESEGLRHLRATWMEHLRANMYGLLDAPPSTGGATARYSLAIHLFLAVMYANCIIHTGDSRVYTSLNEFYPPGSEFLSRNALLIDTNGVMQYPLRTLWLAFECFIENLDSLDQMHADYWRYAQALEHRLAFLVCHVGTSREYNAIELCVPNDANAAAPAPQSQTFTESYEKLSDTTMQYALVYLTTIYAYAENWYCLTNQVTDKALELNTETGVASGVVGAPVVEKIRLSAHAIAEAEWSISSRSMRRLMTFVLQYAHTRTDENYTRALREFMRSFEMRPCDMDLFRVLERTRIAHTLSVTQYEFANYSPVRNAYVRKVHYDRRIYKYVMEHMHWRESPCHGVQSAPLSQQGLQRNLVLLFVLHLFVDNKFGLSFRSRFLLFQRDSSFVTAIQRARAFAYPIIVQQFRRFCVFVPHRREPEQDYRQILTWRAMARRYRQTGAHGDDDASSGDTSLSNMRWSGADVNTDDGVHVRVYDCVGALEAFALWAQFFLQLCRGRVDADTQLTDFLLQVFGWESEYWR